jgi:hypothetical protein
MELVNSTRMIAGYTIGMEPSGRELLVVAVKGTFAIPRNGEAVRLAEEQEPLVMADTFSGDPGFSAPVYEADFAPRKRRCDVLLLGSAYAVGGRPASRVEVGLRVGEVTKTFAVVGNRVWRVGLSGVSASSTELFTQMPISYDRAFGGVDNRSPDPGKHAAFMRNPVGKGFHKQAKPEWIDGAPLPNTEEVNRPVNSPSSEHYAPMAFGPLGRGWDPRRGHAGTYDDSWLKNHCPFLPPDFNDLYYQSAPPEQQLRHVTGGEAIHLVNLTPDGNRSFELPRFEAPVQFFSRKSGAESGTLVLDTITLEPDKERFMVVWRATRPLRKNVFEVAQTVVGRKAVWRVEPVAVPLPVFSDAEDTLPEDLAESDETE